MTPIKKLSDILQDTLALMTDLEVRYRDVSVRFTCYRNKDAVHQSAPITAYQLQTELPHFCKTLGATKLTLLITGSDSRREAIQLYRETFRLARARAPQPAAQLSGAYGYSAGLGNPLSGPLMPLIQQPAGHPSLGGFAGLGAAEVSGIIDKRLSDELLRRDHATV
jgi:hypothetical protein